MTTQQHTWYAEDIIITYKWLPRRSDDDHLAFAIRVRIALTIRVDIVLAFRIGGMQQVHRIAHFCECLGALLRFFLAGRNMRDPYERPLVAESFDRLKRAREGARCV